MAFSKVDWADAVKAVSSNFADKAADEALAENVFGLLAPILAPYLLAAVTANAIPFLGLAIDILGPAIGLAVLNFQGGLFNAEVNANEYESLRHPGT